MALSLADSNKQLDLLLKASNRTSAPDQKDLVEKKKKIDAARKQIELNKQSNADVLSQESYSSDESHSSLSDKDFIVKDFDEEREGPLANLSDSMSGYSDHDDEEDDDNENSMTLDSQSGDEEQQQDVRPIKKRQDKKRKREKQIMTEEQLQLLKKAGKMPRPSDQVRAMQAERKADKKRAKKDMLSSLNEEMEIDKRREQFSNKLEKQIREYEKLRQVASNAFLEAQTEVVRLEEQEKSLSVATMFVLDQEKLSEGYAALKKKEDEFAEKARLFEVRELDLAAQELAYTKKTEEATLQFTEMTDNRVKELRVQTMELERQKEALEKKAKEIAATIPLSTTTTKSTNNLDAFIAEMHRINQNTVSKEVLTSIISPLLMANFGVLALRPNAPTYKVFSTSNNQFIIIDIESAEGAPVLRQVVSKQLYTIK